MSFRFKSLFIAIPAGLFLLFHASAQDPGAKPAAADVRQLQQQMADLQQSLRSMQTQHQQEIAALKTQINSQQELIGKLQTGNPDGAKPDAGDSSSPTPAETKKDEEPLFPTTDASVLADPAAGAGSAGDHSAAMPVTDPLVMTGPDFGLAAPISLGGGGKNYLNLSFVGTVTGAYSSAHHLDELEVGDHDPQQSGFNARNLELALDGAVDPYFEGFANFVFKLDNENETGVEAEEVFMQTTALPWNLQLKGGQFFSPFGRANATHPHTWDFADTSLIQGRFLGPDGLRGVGVQAAWLAPLPWYSRLMLSMQNGNGGTAYSFRNPGEDDGTFYGRETVEHPFRRPEDLLFVPRWENSFDLSPTETILAGVSAGLGPNNTGAEARTELLGVDLFYKWKPADAAGGWPFVKWQTEAMFRRYEAGRGVDDAFPSEETFHDWGIYSQLIWGFTQNWTAGIRGDYLHMEESPFTDVLERQSRERISADLSYFPTEFSKLRLQYNYDLLDGNEFLDSGNEHSVFFQFEFAIGAHAAHKF